jgi:hypothetical protein
MKTTGSLLRLTLFTLVAAAMACTKKDQLNLPKGPETRDTPGSTGALEVKLVAAVRIGPLNYDSLPAQVTLRAWNAGNELTITTHTLPAGANTVSLPTDAVRYQFDLAVWGVQAEKTLAKAEITPGSTIVLQGEATPRLLKAEHEYYEVEGQLYPQAKRLYHYDGNGRLMEIVFWQKKPQSPELQQVFTDKLTYEGQKLATISRHDADNRTVGTTRFSYQNGRVSHIHENLYGRDTYVAVEYPGNDEISMDYLFDNGAAMSYQTRWQGGNRLSDQAFTSHGSGEQGHYAYDRGINPYAFMAWQDIYLSKSSKNNLVGQEKRYSGAIPTADHYKSDYQYNEHGYPALVVKHYRSAQNQRHLYSTTTIFEY